MDSLTVASSFTLAAGILLLILAIFLKKKRTLSLPLPPGLPGWSVNGNIFQLGDKPHQSLFQLANNCGPLMTIKLGMQTTSVVSSPSMPREVLKHNDISRKAINTVNEGAFLPSHNCNMESLMAPIGVFLEQSAIQKFWVPKGWMLCRI